MSYTEDRAAVKRLTRQIDRAEADADAWKWERAERLARMCETRTQRDVATDAGLSQSAVRRAAAVWREHGESAPTQRPTFLDAYVELTGDKSNFGKGRTDTERAKNDAQAARQAVKSNHVKVEDKVGLLKDLVSDPKVLKAYREQRAPKVTEADRKAAQAAASAITQPILNAAGDMQATAVWVGQLRDIAQGISEQELSGDSIRKLDRAVAKVTEEIEVQKLREGMEVI